MTDVFKRTREFGGAISGDSIAMVFTGIDTTKALLPGLTGKAPVAGEAGLILQNVEIQDQQNVSRLYALENNKVYFVSGQTQGGLGATHVVGPQGVQEDFYNSYGDVCGIDGKCFNISMAAKKCGTEVAMPAKNPKIKLNNPLITSLTLRAQVSDMLVFSGFQASFMTLEFTA